MKGILFLLFFCCAIATQSSSAMSAFTLAKIKSCLGGWMSRDEFLGSNDTKIDRGNVFLLDQRKASLKCTNPRTDIVAYATQVDTNHVDLTFVMASGSLGTRTERVRIDSSKISDNPWLAVPGSESGACLGSLSQIVPKILQRSDAVWIKMRKTKVTRPLKLTAGLVESSASRISLQHAEPPDPLPAAMAAEKVEAPSDPNLVSDLAKEMTRAILSIQQNFSDHTSNGDIKSVLKHCQAAHDSMAGEMSDPAANVTLLTNLKTMQRSLDVIQSIFIQPAEGLPTIHDLSKTLSDESTAQ